MKPPPPMLPARGRVTAKAKPDGHCRIHGVAALLENVDADPGGDSFLTGDHALFGPHRVFGGHGAENGGFPGLQLAGRYRQAGGDHRTDQEFL